MARAGSLRSRAIAARMVGSQYSWTRVSSGKVLSSSVASFSASAGSPVRARASATPTTAALRAYRKFSTSVKSLPMCTICVNRIHRRSGEIAMPLKAGFSIWTTTLVFPVAKS